MAYLTIAKHIPFHTGIKITSQRTHMNSGTTIRGMNSNETDSKPEIPTLPEQKILFDTECFDTLKIDFCVAVPTEKG